MHVNTQNKIDESFIRCERLKDEIARLQAEYQSELNWLNTLCKLTGGSASAAACLLVS